MNRGKRKAEATQSPDSKSSKRRADAEDVGNHSASEEEEDIGRIESQQMLLMAGRLKHKDDGWIDKMHGEVDKDEEALNQLLDDKERELADLDSKFYNDIRALLTDVLGGLAPKQSKSNSASDTSHLRPLHEHAQVLFTKAENLINQYNRVVECFDDGRKRLTTDHLQTFEMDKDDVAEMLHAGQELARRQIHQVLQRPDGQGPTRNKTKPLFTDQKLGDVAAIFQVLRDETRIDNEVAEDEQEARLDIAEGDGLFPIIHNTKKGVKKLAGYLLAEEM
ncbi:hypothetical protein QM012_003404 [Aureobasidium pullulans]|uniref:Uncharacterized protein n=1 Tax=Aureobasidium pullulans TaxID=5580 RepID=A0ABR0T8B6_AURPU